MSWLSGKPVVVPIDMSEFSLRACKVAFDIAPSVEQVRVLHVLPVLEPLEPDMTWPNIDEGVRLENAKNTLETFLQEHGYENAVFELRYGDPGAEIARYAEEIEAGLIVIPSHGRGMFRRLLLGSTTDRVMHLSHCPVLVLKEKEKTA